MKTKRERTGYRLFKTATYEPCADALPSGATIDAFDPAAPDRERLARWCDADGKAQTARVVRATKGKHAGADLLVSDVPTWYAELRDHREKVRRFALFTSRKASVDAAETLVKVVADVQTTGRLSSPELVRAVAAFPESIRARLLAVGLLEPERASVAKALTAHLDDFRAALLAKGTSNGQAAQVATRVQRVIDGCKFRRVGDITRNRVAAFLADLRAGSADERPLSQRTSNAYLGAANQFCLWLVRDRRASENPLAGADKLTVTDATKRRALTIDEQRWLTSATATEGQPDRYGMTGKERAMLYCVALGTGFRSGELASLTRASFNLAGNPPTIAVTAGATKNRKGALQPIAPELAAALRKFLRLKAADARAFAMPPRWDVAAMLREDMAAARQTWIEAAGADAERKARTESAFLLPTTDEGVADFHSLRHTFGTNLARAGTATKTAMDLMRHSDVNLTMRLYSHTVVGERAAALVNLPDLSQPVALPARKTGTDNRPVSLARSLAQIGTPGHISLDSVDRTDGKECGAQVVENAEETALSPMKNSLRPAGFEPATPGLGNRCSILLSYERARATSAPARRPSRRSTGDYSPGPHAMHRGNPGSPW